MSSHAPTRPDARVNEAKAMLSMRRTLDGLTGRGLACQFNLWPGTAGKLLDDERERRRQGRL